MDESKLKDARGNFDREKMDDAYFHLSGWTLGEQYDYTLKHEQADKAKQLVELKALYRRLGFTIPSLVDKETRNAVLKLRTKERLARRRVIAQKSTRRLSLSEWLTN